MNEEKINLIKINNLAKEKLYDTIKDKIKYLPDDCSLEYIKKEIKKNPKDEFYYTFYIKKRNLILTQYIKNLILTKYIHKNISKSKIIFKDYIDIYFKYNDINKFFYIEYDGSLLNLKENIYKLIK